MILIMKLFKKKNNRKKMLLNLLNQINKFLIKANRNKMHLILFKNKKINKTN